MEFDHGVLSTVSFRLFFGRINNVGKSCCNPYCYTIRTMSYILSEATTMFDICYDFMNLNYSANMDVIMWILTVSVKINRRVGCFNHKLSRSNEM